MTLKELYSRVASLIGNQGIADCLSSATFLEIDCNKIAFKTFVETEHQAAQEELAAEYILPRYILLWKMNGSMWFIEGAETEIEFNAILKAKAVCSEVTNIIRVDSDKEYIEIISPSNSSSNDKGFRRKRGMAKGRKHLMLLPS
jgi:hypothetical protein